MTGRRIGRLRPKPGKAPSPEEVAKVVKELKKMASPAFNYRERSLAIHGLICAKCAREFDESTKHLLTVHHKDGNDAHNPPDGSNWENLCVYCHEAEHSKSLLGDYITGKKRR